MRIEYEHDSRSGEFSGSLERYNDKNVDERDQIWLNRDVYPTVFKDKRIFGLYA